MQCVCVCVHGVPKQLSVTVTHSARQSGVNDAPVEMESLAETGTRLKG